MKVNRRTILSLIGPSPAVLAGSSKLAKAAAKSAAVVKADAGKITAVNPRGLPPAIQLIPMAPRLNSLDGKTIYLVSDGFPSADTFLNQIKIWFNKNMPSVNIEYRLKAGGFADDDPQLFAEMKQKANAAIMAIGHCSTCTPATVGHCMTFEKMGLPSAPLVTVAFKDLAKTNAAKRGMPNERICFTPHPIWGKSESEMYAYLEGNDPVTGKPLMKEVVGALTNPLTAEDQKTGTVTPYSTVTAKEYRESFLAHAWLYPRALKGEEPLATWWKTPDDVSIPVVPKPDDISLVVAGGQTNAFFQVGNMNYGRSASIDHWA